MRAETRRWVRRLGLAYFLLSGALTALSGATFDVIDAQIAAATGIAAIVWWAWRGTRAVPRGEQGADHPATRSAH